MFRAWLSVRRNQISWGEKFEYDLDYLRHISFWFDFEIVLKTIVKVLEREGITSDGAATAVDLGDYLLLSHQVSREYYSKRQDKAQSPPVTESGEGGEQMSARYSVLMSVYDKVSPQELNLSIESMLGQTVKPGQFVIVFDGPVGEDLKRTLSTVTVCRNRNYLQLYSFLKNRGLACTQCGFKVLSL